MDVETAWESWREIYEHGPHWPDAVELLRDEIASSTTISPEDRSRLITLLDEIDGRWDKELAREILLVLLRNEVMHDQFGAYAPSLLSPSKL